VFLPNFQKQSVRLILLAVLDSTVGKNAEIMNTRIFKWKTLSPTKEKNHDLPLVGFPHFTITGKFVTK